MLPNGLSNCLYCGSDAIVVSNLSKRIVTTSINSAVKDFLSVSSQNTEEYEIKFAPLEVQCEFCSRQYILIATRKNVEFIERLLSHIEFKDETAIAQELASFGINPVDMFSNVRGVVMPKSKFNTIRKWLSSRIHGVGFEFHVLFESNNRQFYLAVYRNNRTGEMVGKRIEKIR